MRVCAHVARIRVSRFFANWQWREGVGRPWRMMDRHWFTPHLIVHIALTTYQEPRVPQSRPHLTERQRVSLGALGVFKLFSPTPRLVPLAYLAYGFNCR
eukprot:5732031-Prymnesium_polylepis.1